MRIFGTNYLRVKMTLLGILAAIDVTLPYWGLVFDIHKVIVFALCMITALLIWFALELWGTRHVDRQSQS